VDAAILVIHVVLQSAVLSHVLSHARHAQSHAALSLSAAHSLSAATKHLKWDKLLAGAFLSAT